MSDSKYTPLDEHENEGNLFSTNVSDFDSPMKHHHHSFFKTKTFKILLVVAAILTLVLLAAIVFILTKTSHMTHSFNLASQWDADFDTGVKVGPMNITGHIWMDSSKQKLKIDVMDVASLIFNHDTSYTVVRIPTCTYNTTKFPPTLASGIKFNWTFDNVVSTYIDENGKKGECDLFSTPPMDGLSMQLCLVNDETLAFARFNSAHSPNSTYQISFSHFQVNKTKNSDFEAPKNCELIENSTFPSGPKRSLFDHVSGKLLTYLIV